MSSKDLRIDTRNVRFTPILNCHNGKIIRKGTGGKVEEWMSIDELIKYLSVCSTVSINDLDGRNSSVIKTLQKHFNCWYHYDFKTKEDLLLKVNQQYEKIVIPFSLLTEELLEGLEEDNLDRLAVSFPLHKMRNRKQDDIVFTKLKGYLQKIKYLIVNLDDKHESREITETTSQIYDLLKKEAAGVRISINASGLKSRSELQLLLACDVDLHLGTPLHNELITLGDVYGCVLNDIWQSKFMNLPKDALPVYSTTVVDSDGVVYDQCYSTKKTVVESINKRVGVYWSRYTELKYEVKEHKIERVYLTNDKTGLVYLIAPINGESEIKHFKPHIRRRVDTMELNSTNVSCEQLKRELIGSVSEQCWGSALNKLYQLIKQNGGDIGEEVDRLDQERSVTKVYQSALVSNPGWREVESGLVKSGYFSCFDLDLDLFKYKKVVKPIYLVFDSVNRIDLGKEYLIGTNCEYVARNWLKRSGLKYKLVVYNLSSNDLLTANESAFDAIIHTQTEVTEKHIILDRTSLYHCSQDPIEEEYSDLESIIGLFEFENFELVEETEKCIIKKHNDLYYYYHLKNSIKQIDLLKSITTLVPEHVLYKVEDPFAITSIYNPDHVSMHVNGKGQISFIKDGSTISDDIAADFINVEKSKELIRRVTKELPFEESVTYWVDQEGDKIYNAML